MTERVNLLQKLVNENHVNMEEKQTLGCVTRAEIARVIRALLVSNSKFPGHAQIADPNSQVPIYEGAILHRLESGQTRITWQRHQAINPSVLAESRSEDLSDVDLAVERYINTTWPNGIDGISLS
jgi:hypothetical protein